ncbi:MULTISPECIES: transposase [Gammaproteobacteria]|uniref:integrase catalytic domain-containing protein n=1 Tax=Gammaproteobacteria TaxID=1236 RepID=UPI000DCF9933|nr:MULTISPECIES: transposase [Gammaproteobacteria]RTE85509.1 transposase [Aliidiomarina sp. B3213]TCZ89478.1 transposase [Lysobacter sp. N42]
MGMVVAHSSTNFDYRVNELLVHKSVPGLVYTVCWTFPTTNRVALSLQRVKPCKPIVIAIGDPIDGYAFEGFDRAENDFIGSDLYNSVTEEKEVDALRKYQIIKPLIDTQEIELYIKGDLSKEVLEKYASAGSISVQTLYKYLNQYLAFGSHRLALLPMTHVCGKGRKLPLDHEAANEMKKTRGGNYIGRKGLSDDYLRRDFNQEDETRIKKFIKSILPRAQNHHLSALFALYSSKLCTKIINVYGIEELIPDPLKLISLEQFSYHFKKNVNYKKWEVYKTSSKNVQNNHELTVGRAQDYSLGPSHTYEIDATTLNLYVVSRVQDENGKDSPKVLGRPYLYFIVDSYSTMIVGYTLTFQTGTAAVKRALYNAFTNKVEFCRKYGIPIDDSDWPCEHVCTRLLCDRAGEYTTKLFDDIIAEDLKLETITYAPAYLGKRKGTVEVNFNAIDQIVIQQLDGSVKRRPAKDSAHPSNFARYDIQTLNQLVIKAILSFNKRRVNFSRLQTFDVLDGVAPTPISIWNRHISGKMGGGVRRPKEQIKYALLDRVEATIGKSGITLKSNRLSYFTEHKAFQEWQTEIMLRKTPKTIDVRTNPDDPRFAWFRSKQFDNEIIEFSIGTNLESYAELVYEEIQQLRELQARSKSINRKDRNLDRFELQNLINSNQSSTKKVIDRKGMVAGIKDNFKAEQQAEIVRDSIESRLDFGTLDLSENSQMYNDQPTEYKDE